MELIKNVEVGTCDIDPLVVSTSGVSSCIAVVIELENKIFIYHADPESFIASTTCSIGDAHTFLMKIFDNLYQLDAYTIIKNVYIIGGWNNINYMTLRNQINIIRDHCAMTMKQNSTLPPNNFDLFLSAIKLNLIGFNLPVKKADGEDKGENDDDNPNDYVWDFTIVYDRSSTPHTFVICQYAGREDEMDAARSDSLLQAIYEIDPTSKHLRAFICSNAPKSPYHFDFLNQVLLNVNDPSSIHHSFDNDSFKKKIDDLLSRIESTSFFD